jgi:hypothetical protein
MVINKYWLGLSIAFSIFFLHIDQLALYRKVSNFKSKIFYNVLKALHTTLVAILNLKQLIYLYFILYTYFSKSFLTINGTN